MRVGTAHDAIAVHRIEGVDRQMNAPVAMRSPPPVASEPLDISFESDALSVLERNFAVHGDAFRMFSPVLQRPIWVLSHPDHVRHVLVDRSANFTKGIGIELDQFRLPFFDPAAEIVMAFSLTH
jgi:cytochrome P450